MTKEEINSIRSDDMPFIEALYKIFVQTFGRSEGYEGQEKIRKTPSGRYLWRVHERIWEIKRNMEDIALTERLISAQEPGIRLDRTVNAAQLIRYDYENFFLRMGKMKDMLLLLTNEVMMLGLKKGLGLESDIQKKLAPKYPVYTTIWADIKKELDQLKPYRNHLAHNGFIEHPDLALVESYYTLELKFKNLLEQYRHEAVISDTQKELVEKFTAIIQSYLANTDQLLKLLYLFLYAPFMENIARLIEQERELDLNQL